MTKTASLTFKTKAVPLRDGDATIDSYKIPTITRAHCDMPAFRIHPRFGGLANSDLFLGMINRHLKNMYPSGWIRADKLNSQTALQSAFLTTVTITF